MELNSTVRLMNSQDYKERFQAEYWQTKIRYDKLHKMTIKYEANKLNFTPSCSLDLLNEQKKHMGMYLHCLEVRAEIEGISLEHIDESLAYRDYINQLTTTSPTYSNNTTIKNDTGSTSNSCEVCKND